MTSRPTVRTHRSDVPVHAAQSAPSVAVYAAAASVAAAVPLPLIDTFFSSVVRGAAMRRVALRRGVFLEPRARKILAESNAKSGFSNARFRIARNIASRVFPPLRMIARIEDAAATAASSLLFDHYLATEPRPPERPIEADEAKRIRAALDHAISQGSLDALRETPGSAIEILLRAIEAGRTPDPDRKTFERILDAFLDGLADAPADLVDRLRDRFDAYLVENP